MPRKGSLSIWLKKQERHPVPIIDEILKHMTGATVFSKLDPQWSHTPGH